MSRKTEMAELFEELRKKRLLEHAGRVRRRNGEPERTKGFQNKREYIIALEDLFLLFFREGGVSKSVTSPGKIAVRSGSGML